MWSPISSFPRYLTEAHANLFLFFWGGKQYIWLLPADESSKIKPANSRLPHAPRDWIFSLSRVKMLREINIHKDNGILCYQKYNLSVYNEANNHQIFTKKSIAQKRNTIRL